MSLKSRNIFGLMVSVILALSIAVNPAFSANDFIQTELRYKDLPYVINAKDYQISLKAVNRNKNENYSDVFTYAWIGLFLDNNPNAPKYPDKFVQIGIKAGTNGYTWFVYAEPGVA